MQNQWDDQEVDGLEHDLLAMRVYSSQLLGRETGLVLHGGGNTSVKSTEVNYFGESEELLYVKGSGWDLDTIERPGFAPVKMDTLLKLAELETLTDVDMVRLQRAAMTDPNAPNPSVEAILHAIIPYTFVDHTHADAVVALSNTEEGEARIKALYGNRVLIIPYIMPGFILARAIFERSRNVNWQELDAIILLNHGVFTFADTAKDSYDRMIDIVSVAEDYLYDTTNLQFCDSSSISLSKIVSGIDKGDIASTALPLMDIAKARKAVSDLKGLPMLVMTSRSTSVNQFARLENCAELISRGPLTPDHVIRTKPTGVFLQEPVTAVIDSFARNYQQYFDHNSSDDVQCLDLAPRWGIIPKVGSVAFGRSLKDVKIIADIIDHTLQAILIAEELGGWMPISEADIFDMEYWELEQAKLKKGSASLEFQGKIALVTGAASGIGRACVDELLAKGAVVAALDNSPTLEGLFTTPSVISICCDVTDAIDLADAVEETVAVFGGLDLMVSNAGYFPNGDSIETLKEESWDKSLSLNLTSHKNLLTSAIPFLKQGIDPAIVIIGSKNVPAPGPGAAAYSVAKAGLTQLCRVAAMELGEFGIRVNVVHPNAVFDTAVWTERVLKSRAEQYGLSVQAYKTNNLLKQEVSSKDVASLVCTVLGDSFKMTTGAQVPIDGGNDRVI
ncbi:MAG: bifunctional aldolase/short-chain dehydrogenase [Pseudomonadales bacterium]|nr:bifunctional aldolase/short-chain dehydrogenase [Pseudomonadales bacterium]